MSLEELATRIVRDNAKARSLAREWSSRITKAITSESSELLNGIINEFERTAEGDVTKAPGSSGTDQPVDDAGGV